MSKFVVGDGPQLASFKSQYPNVCFTGAKTCKDLAYHYANADVGALDEDLNVVVRCALTVPAWKCREYALAYSWDRSVEQFLSNIHVFR